MKSNSFIAVIYLILIFGAHIIETRATIKRHKRIHSKSLTKMDFDIPIFLINIGKEAGIPILDKIMLQLSLAVDPQNPDPNSKPLKQDYNGFACNADGLKKVYETESDIFKQDIIDNNIVNSLSGQKRNCDKWNEAYNGYYGVFPLLSACNRLIEDLNMNGDWDPRTNEETWVYEVDSYFKNTGYENHFETFFNANEEISKKEFMSKLAEVNKLLIPIRVKISKDYTFSSKVQQEKSDIQEKTSEIMTKVRDQIKKAISKNYNVMSELGGQLSPGDCDKFDNKKINIGFFNVIKSGWRTFKWSVGCMNKEEIIKSLAVAGLGLVITKVIEALTGGIAIAAKITYYSVRALVFFVLGLKTDNPSKKGQYFGSAVGNVIHAGLSVVMKRKLRRMK